MEIRNNGEIMGGIFLLIRTDVKTNQGHPSGALSRLPCLANSARRGALHFFATGGLPDCTLAKLTRVVSTVFLFGFAESASKLQ